MQVLATTVCKKCGHKLELPQHMTCPKCGTDILDSAPIKVAGVRDKELTLGPPIEVIGVRGLTLLAKSAPTSKVGDLTL